jgi:2-amino-4-hydroxy-6-hydroxymethyldihydropteridine diphosphokinase
VTRAYLGLGSNLGDKIKHLEEAVRLIGKQQGIDIVAASSIYETEPIGFVDQPSFLNCVVVIDTDLLPRELLVAIGSIESELKRKRAVYQGPRTIDIDILLYNDKVVDEPGLMIPHPKIIERAFVLVPLIELTPEIEVPGFGRAYEYLAGVAGQDVKKLAAFNIDAIMGE